jgi:flagellar biosynthesis protein
MRRRPYRPIRPIRPDRDGQRQAVALTYDVETMPAPTLTASGRGALADRIISLAREHGIPVQEDPALMGLLSQLEVGQIVPPELYRVVAEVLAFVYRLEARRATDRSTLHKDGL